MRLHNSEENTNNNNADNVGDVSNISPNKQSFQ